MCCATKEEKSRVDSQMKIVVRPWYSNPPRWALAARAGVCGLCSGVYGGALGVVVVNTPSRHGARVAAEVLTNPELR